MRRSSSGPEAGGLLSSDAGRSALCECDELLLALGRAGDKQRSLAHFVNVAIAAGTASIPVLLLLSTRYWDFFLGKLAPAVLASLTTTAAVLLQLIKPHERWRLLRSKQGTLQVERLRYVHRIPPYNGDETSRDKRLLERVAKTAAATYQEWSRLQVGSADAAHMFKSSG